MLKLYYLFILLSLPLLMHGQENNESKHYLVELEKFTPPVQDMIRSFEGFPATPFMANDMNNEERFLGDFQSKLCLLFFWNTRSAESISIYYDLDKLQQEFGQERLAIVAMADDNRAEITEFLESNPSDLIIIPNTRMLSEAVYGVELGYPRIFVIDRYGVIQHVFPKDFFIQDSDHYKILQGLIRNYIQ